MLYYFFEQICITVDKDKYLLNYHFVLAIVSGRSVGDSRHALLWTESSDRKWCVEEDWVNYKEP